MITEADLAKSTYPSDKSLCSLTLNNHIPEDLMDLMRGRKGSGSPNQENRLVTENEIASLLEKDPIEGEQSPLKTTEVYF